VRVHALDHVGKGARTGQTHGGERENQHEEKEIYPAMLFLGGQSSSCVIAVRDIAQNKEV